MITTDEFKNRKFRLTLKSYSEEPDLIMDIEARHRIEALDKIRKSPILVEFPVEVLNDHLEEL